MPELPEVETMRRGVSGIVGSTITDVVVPNCRLKAITIRPRPGDLRRRVRGQRIVGVERFGKRVAVRLTDGSCLVFEPRMTGLLLLKDPPNQEHLRLGFRLKGKTPFLWYWDRRGLGSIRLVSPAQEKKLYGPTRLGPDALSLDAEQLEARLKPSKRAIKVALLDQRAVAGIGNLYASEILHLSGIHPAMPCSRLSSNAYVKMHAAMVHVLNEAIRYEGSTLSDGTYRNALSAPGGYQLHHRVYARHGESCRQCERGTIVRVVQAQRATFYCPQCQQEDDKVTR